MRLGVDFGTSHTVAVLAYPDGRTKSMLFDDGTPLLRSAVYADSDGTVQVGRDAVRRAGLDPTRYEPNPKQRIDESTVLLGDSEHRVIDLFAAVLGRVVSEVRRVAGSIPQDVVMTYPAAWGARRREILTTAAANAGLHNVRTIPEPVGAAVYFTTVLGHSVADGRPLGVFDFGGGTLDVAVVRRDGNTFTVLSSGGLSDLGGVDLDSALVDHLGQLIAQRDPALWNRLAHPQNSNDRRARQLLWDDVRGAKESLSRTTSAPVNVPETDSDLHLTRDEFERLTTPLLQRAINETQRVIREARCEPSQLNGLFLVGGSSRVPLVARMLHSGLGIAPTVLEQPEVAVAEGAAKLGAAKGGPGTPPSSPMSAPPSPMSNAPMSTPPMQARPMSAPPVSNSPMSPPAPRTNAPMSGPPSPARPVSAAPMSPAPMSPAPMHQPRAYTPPPQPQPQPTYPPRQQAYTPPPPRPPVLPPVQHRPAPPPPQPQIVQVPYAVPVPVAPQPVMVPRKKSYTGKIIAAIIVAVIGLCCYGVVFKPAVTAGLFDEMFSSGPTMHGTVPSGMAAMYDPWKDVLEECWVNTPDTWAGGIGTTPLDDLIPKVSSTATSIYCTFDSDTNTAYWAKSILFVDQGGEKLVEAAASKYDLTDGFAGYTQGVSGGSYPAYAAIDGSYTSTIGSSEMGMVIAGDTISDVDDLTGLFNKYAAK